MLLFAEFQTSISSILGDSGDFFKAQEASHSIQASTEQLLPSVQELVAGITTSESAGFRVYVPWILGVLVAVFLFLLGRALINDARKRADLSVRQNRETQDAILKLLDEMGNLADGDLTIEAEVTDQVTGAIADSVNFAVKEMRELVARINAASQQVAKESQATASTAQALSSGQRTSSRGNHQYHRNCQDHVTLYGRNVNGSITIGRSRAQFCGCSQTRNAGGA